MKRAREVLLAMAPAGFNIIMVHAIITRRTAGKAVLRQSDTTLVREYAQSLFKETTTHRSQRACR